MLVIGWDLSVCTQCRIRSVFSVSSIQKSSFAVSRNELYVDLSYNFVGFVQPLGRSNALGVSVIYLDSGQMEETTIAQPEGTGSYFRWEAFSVGVSYAQYITDRLRLGGTVKYIREGVFHEKAQTLAIDVGTLLDTGVLGLRLGMSVTNLGGQMKFSNPPLNPENQVTGNERTTEGRTRLETESFPLPLSYRLGISTDLVGIEGQIHKSEKSRVTVGIDALDPNDAVLRSNFGVEYEWNGLLFLRGGYRGIAIEEETFSEYSTSSYTFGAGLHYSFSFMDIQFDYALSDYQLLGASHHFTLGVSF